MPRIDLPDRDWGPYLSVVVIEAGVALIGFPHLAGWMLIAWGALTVVVGFLD